MPDRQHFARLKTQIEQIERQIVLHKERQLNIQKQRERALQTLESLKAEQDSTPEKKTGTDARIPKT